MASLGYSKWWNKVCLFLFITLCPSQFWPVQADIRTRQQVRCVHSLSQWPISCISWLCKNKSLQIQTFHGRKEFSFKKHSLQVGTFRLFMLRTGCPFVCKLYIHISQLLSAVSWMFLNLPMNHCQWFPYAGYLVSLFISVLSSSIWGSLEESLTDNTETSFLKIYFYTSFGS